MKKISHYRSGFTLVELMLVIAIISVLVVALYPSFQGYLARAHDTETRTKMGQFARALENYMLDKDTWLIPGTQGGGTGAIDYNPALADFSPIPTTYAAEGPSIVGALADAGYIDKTTIPEVKNIEDSKYTLSACTFTAFSVSSKVNYPGNTDTDETSYGCNIPNGYNTATTRGNCISDRGSGQNCLGQVIGAGPSCGNGAANYPVCDTPPSGYCWVYIIDNGGGHTWGSSMVYQPGYILLGNSASYTDPATGISWGCGLGGSD